MTTYDFLRKVPLFAGLPDDDLSRLCDMVERVELAAGEVLFTEGSKGDRVYVIESGELEVIKSSGHRPVLLAVRTSGDVIGEIALLEETPRTATVQARTPSVLIAIGQERFDLLINSSPTASRAMLHTVLARWRNINATLRQSEKMAQLGTLTAGVAHELNNPAAAVRRGAGQLQEAFDAFAEAQDELARISFNAAQQAVLTTLAQEARAAASKPAPVLDALARSDRQAELEDWLDQHAVAGSWEIAPTLVDLGYDPDQLAVLAAAFAADQLAALVRWLGATYAVANLLAEIGQGASRISEIVKALKSYAYLDQAPVQAVDIHDGLDNTLLILRHKLRGIEVQREYAADLPRIQGYGSELNQVWTNLIDNAADVLQNVPAPRIVLRTEHSGQWINVEVEDNGAGIPLDIQPRIFESFFTTKPPGQGAGLGLDITYNIVVNKHHGDIKAFSQPGHTRFKVRLPVNFEETITAQTPVVPLEKANDEQVRHVLEMARTIAVVGISAKPDRPAHSVPAYLQAQGYRIIPVNPSLQEVLGERAYPDLLSVPESIDVVDIFRRSEEVLPIVEQAIRVGAKAVWMQEGVINEPAADLARRAGLDVVVDSCMRAAHRRLIGEVER